MESGRWLFQTADRCRRHEGDPAPCGTTALRPPGGVMVSAAFAACPAAVTTQGVRQCLDHLPRSLHVPVHDATPATTLLRQIGEVILVGMQPSFRCLNRAGFMNICKQRHADRLASPSPDRIAGVGSVGKTSRELSGSAATLPRSAQRCQGPDRSRNHCDEDRPQDFRRARMILPPRHCMTTGSSGRLANDLRRWLARGRRSSRSTSISIRSTCSQDASHSLAQTRRQGPETIPPAVDVPAEGCRCTRRWCTELARWPQPSSPATPARCHSNTTPLAVTAFRSNAGG